MPRSEIARARAATAAVFFVTGAVIAAWSTRLPAIQERLALSPGALGAAILGLEAGAVAGLPAGGALVARAGSRTALRLGFVGYPLGLLAVGLAGSQPAPAGPPAAVGLRHNHRRPALEAPGVLA